MHLIVSKNCMQLGWSLQHSQELHTCPCPESDQSSSHLNPVSHNATSAASFRIHNLSTIAALPLRGLATNSVVQHPTDLKLTRKDSRGRFIPVTGSRGP
jgi:hypothetical protein